MSPGLNMNQNFKKYFNTYAQAILTKDLELFLSIFDENLEVFDMWEKWSLSGLSEWRQVTKEWFDSLDSERVIIEFSDVKEHVTEDMGYVTCFVKFQAQNLAGENLRYLDNRLTWVLKRKNKDWKIVHQHTSSPLDNSAKVMLQRSTSK
jgi:ketosteroid isomerase-like protein